MKNDGYMAHYENLKSSANQLAEMEEPDVDKIIPLVTKGLESYKQCKERIEAVRQQLAATQSL